MTRRPTDPCVLGMWLASDVSLGPESEFECECPLTEVLPPSLDDVVLCQGLDGVADDITFIIYLSLLSLTGDTIDAK